MFDRASLKLGLDKAVLQSMSGRDNSLGGGAGGGVSWKIVQMIWNRNGELNHLVSKLCPVNFSKRDVCFQTVLVMNTIHFTS